MAGVLVVDRVVRPVGPARSRYVPWPVIEGFTDRHRGHHLLAAGPERTRAWRSPRVTTPRLVAVRAVGDAVAGDGTLAALGLVAVVVGRDGRASSTPHGRPGIAARRDRRDRRSRSLPDVDVARIGSLPDSLPVPSLPECRSSAWVTCCRRRVRDRRARRDREPPVGEGRRRHVRQRTPRSRPRAVRSGSGQHRRRRSSAACPRPARSPAPPSTCAPVLARACRPSCTRSCSCSSCCSAARSSPASRSPRSPACSWSPPYGWSSRTTCARCVRATRGDALVLVVTAAVTIVFDLILAVEVGVAVAAIARARAVARSAARASAEPVHRDAEIDADDRASVCCTSTSSCTASTARCSSAPRSGSSPSSPPWAT